MKRILLHICCGPCAITCVERLQDQGYAVTGLFYNPNIHPGQEYLKRRDGALEAADKMGFPLLFADPGGPLAEYDVRHFFRSIANREHNRCLYCYRVRLFRTARFAVENGFDLISSSLLYSRYQRHDSIRAIGEAVCRQSGGVEFHYEDFRTGWSRGITLSKKWGIYRQQYCGCIFSESERYLSPSNLSRPEFTGAGDSRSQEEQRGC
ncbi:MAG: epoxyqueuosine reductase QueH [Desulfovibrionaceae bacterium]|nr:epoxyqueuosine reductase QueH [Desulfovibrionaceae bacterium]